MRTILFMSPDRRTQNAIRNIEGVTRYGMPLITAEIAIFQYLNDDPSVVIKPAKEVTQEDIDRDSNPDEAFELVVVEDYDEFYKAFKETKKPKWTELDTTKKGWVKTLKTALIKIHEFFSKKEEDRTEWEKADLKAQIATKVIAENEFYEAAEKAFVYRMNYAMQHQVKFALSEMGVDEVYRFRLRDIWGNLAFEPDVEGIHKEIVIKTLCIQQRYTVQRYVDESGEYHRDVVHYRVFTNAVEGFIKPGEKELEYGDYPFSFDQPDNPGLEYTQELPEIYSKLPENVTWNVPRVGKESTIDDFAKVWHFNAKDQHKERWSNNQYIEVTFNGKNHYSQAASESMIRGDVVDDLNLKATEAFVEWYNTLSPEDQATLQDPETRTCPYCGNRIRMIINRPCPKCDTIITPMDGANANCDSSQYRDPNYRLGWSNVEWASEDDYSDGSDERLGF